jgi:hypothetical protein
MYENKVDTKDEPLQRNYDASTHVNNAAVLCKITGSPVKLTGLGFQGDVGHFEQLP